MTEQLSLFQNDLTFARCWAGCRDTIGHSAFPLGCSQAKAPSPRPKEARGASDYENMEDSMEDCHWEKSGIFNTGHSQPKEMPQGSQEKVCPPAPPSCLLFSCPTDQIQTARELPDGVSILEQRKEAEPGPK